MTDGTRLFLGFDVSIECANELRELASALQNKTDPSAIAWVAPARYHVTLKYLGWARPEVVPAIRDRVAAVVSEQQELAFTIGELGAFPALSKARVLWMGVQDGRSLAGIAKTLDEAMADLGFPRETREFHPHVTLGRPREVADLSQLDVGSVQKYSRTRCKFLNLYESDLDSSTSGYPVRASWELKATKRQRSDLEQRDN